MDDRHLGRTKIENENMYTTKGPDETHIYKKIDKKRVLRHGNKPATRGYQRRIMETDNSGGR
jgi:hypothetical protein